MPGMNTGLSTNNPAIVSAFQAALLHQGLLVLLVVALVAVAWNVLRSLQLRRAAARAGARWPSCHQRRPSRWRDACCGSPSASSGSSTASSRARRRCPLGMVPQAVQPTAAASPAWVQHLVDAGTTIWTYHPVSAAAAAVWAQVGIGAWLLVAPRHSYLGADARRVEIVAINANPRYITPDYLVAFDQQEGLGHVANWLYLTGTLPELRAVWKSYGEAVVYFPGGAMIGHSEYAWVIDASGRTRYILDTDPGPATSATQSSFAVMLSDAVKAVMGNR